MSNERIEYTLLEHGISLVQLNRPEKQNAFDLKMFLALKKTINRIKRNRKVRAVIICGEGKSFSSGLDVKKLLNNPSAAVRLLWKWLPGNPNLAQYVSIGWRQVPVPVIAVLHGRCWGAGMQLALGCDYRIAHPETSLSIMESRWGLIPDMAGNIGVRENIPLDKAMMTTMLAEELLAKEALKVHLISEVAEEPLERAKQLAIELTMRSPDTLAAIKKLMTKNFFPNQRRILAKETWYQWRMILSANRALATKKNQDNTIKYKRRSWW